MILDFKTNVYFGFVTLDILPCSKYYDQLYYLIKQLEWHNNEIKELELESLDILPTDYNNYTKQLIAQLEWHNNEIKEIESLDILPTDFSDTASSRSYRSDSDSDY